MSTKEFKQNKDSSVGGLILIGIGGAVLFLQNVNVPDAAGLLILPLLAAIFMAAGVINRNAGPMVPGGILAGVGLGTIMTSSESGLSFWGIDGGALFMFAFALGWFSITLMSALFSDETQRWPLIPGSIMALIAATILDESLFAPVWELLSTGWPIGMIAVGVWSLIKALSRD